VGVLGLKNSLLLKVARRWIAGVDLDSALGDAKKTNSNGFGVILNFLGEDVTDQSVADAHIEEYLKLQRALDSSGIRGFASVKLTQFGLGTDDQRALQRLSEVALNAKRLHQLLWVDMEGSAFTGKTIDAYLQLLATNREVGIALQAYMRRSGDDLKVLLDRGAKVRLVKGAYREPPGIVFPTRREVSANFGELMRLLFERGDNFAIGTHDSKLVDDARKLADSSHANFRFEMLKGIRNELKSELVASGYKVSEYLPYGDQWYAYSTRRLSEHPSNVLLLVRSLV
jgi:proline dehydrogenase